MKKVILYQNQHKGEMLSNKMLLNTKYEES